MHSYKKNVLFLFPINYNDVPLFIFIFDTFHCHKHKCFIIPKMSIGIIKNSFGKTGIDISQLVP